MAECGIAAFNRDALEEGYQYNRADQRLSTRLAVARRNRAVFAMMQRHMGDTRSVSIVDIGCGDGVASRLLFDTLKPRQITGIDAAESAVALATRNHAVEGRLHFARHDACQLPFAPQSFDLAILRESLHHMEAPDIAIAEAARVARHMLILEPNGYNPVLKVIEKTSRYHIEHGERSFFPHRLEHWVRGAGASVIDSRYTGIIPVFAPDWLARLLGRIEPFFERLLVVRRFYCASVVMWCAKD